MIKMITRKWLTFVATLYRPTVTKVASEDIRSDIRDGWTNGRTDGQRDTSLNAKLIKRHKSIMPLGGYIQRSVRPLCLSGASILWGGGPSAMLHRNLRESGIKIRDQPLNKRKKLVSWLSGKSLKLLRPDVTFKAKMRRIRFLASVCSSVRSFVRVCLMAGFQGYVFVDP